MATCAQYAPRLISRPTVLVYFFTGIRLKLMRILILSKKNIAAQKIQQIDEKRFGGNSGTQL